ncbi:hypothetical protein [Cellulomonas marina]|uniref:Uncharacterized protein n=1 Tax=Cellulomonas marina TaxID=988821 RepID=A0A1I0VZA8_9CELL|nr:hypothetical protein [Cellulomonas marina]GIG27476.1 hypothetical protein Cma02nite_00760 [Cellulomonas marina]SFA81223.1 hypothetical protein SAMN05421867_10239 [Cellulomonas marina]
MRVSEREREQGRTRVRERLLVGVLLLVVSGFALLLLAGHGPWAGPVLVTITQSHGINEGDVVVVVGWLAAAVCAALLVRRR